MISRKEKCIDETIIPVLFVTHGPTPALALYLRNKLLKSCLFVALFHRSLDCIFILRRVVASIVGLTILFSVFTLRFASTLYLVLEDAIVIESL